jgi:methionyl aminopeptidase
MSVDTPEELEGLRQAGVVAAEVLRTVGEAVEPGVTTAELDDLAAERMRAAGARSAPIITYGFPGAICISIGNEIVHGIPGRRRLVAGDVVKLDVSLEVDGFFADTATTVIVEPVASADARLVAATRAALKRGMRAAVAGATLRDVGENVERIAEARGFSVLRELVGHGIGRALHEPPTVYNYAEASATERLREGMVLTVEPMVAGTRKILGTGDGWTVVTAGEPIVLTAA